MTKTELVFLKLGGSVITDKKKSMTPSRQVIQRLADEIASAIKSNPNLRLVIGHGSGSFGHAVANKHQTQSGGDSKIYWQGFIEVWRAARTLNQMVINALNNADLPVMAFPPSSGIISDNRQIKSWGIEPLKLALSHGIIPVVQGDIIFDASLGGTILSTEAVFQHLAKLLEPQEILIAGLEKGVYRDFHHPDEIVYAITPTNINQVLPGLTSSQTVDVTGGMLTKVKIMLSLVEDNPELKVHIFSGVESMNLYRALNGEIFGTLIADSV